MRSDSKVWYYIRDINDTRYAYVASKLVDKYGDSFFYTPIVGLSGETNGSRGITVVDKIYRFTSHMCNRMGRSDITLFLSVIGPMGISLFLLQDDGKDHEDEGYHPITYGGAKRYKIWRNNNWAEWREIWADIVFKELEAGKVRYLNALQVSMGIEKQGKKLNASMVERLNWDTKLYLYAYENAIRKI